MTVGDKSKEQIAFAVMAAKMQQPMMICTMELVGGVLGPAESMKNMPIRESIS